MHMLWHIYLMEFHKQVEMNEIALHFNLHEFTKCSIKKGNQTK